MPYTDKSNGPTDPVTGGPLVGSIGAIAAAGSTTADATALAYGVNLVSAANATKGVRLAAPLANQLGTRIIVVNTVAAVLNVYPDTGGTIDGAAADAVAALAASTRGEFILTAVSSSGVGTWIGIESAKAV